MTKAVNPLCMGCMSPLEGEKICPTCGYAVDGEYDVNYIKPGTVLASRYIVGRLVRKNGQGARYVGFDNSIQVAVWIDEYFPRTIAQRDHQTGDVLPIPGLGAQYKALMSDFVDIANEIRRLSITEPVVPLDNVVNENKTVYSIYKNINVIPLEAYLAKKDGKLSAEEALPMFIPLLNTLSTIHAHGLLHRGISPYTVYVSDDGELYFWDFALSATRTANSEFESELWSGYSAPEQYSSSGWQGTWTDVYAIAALIYRTLSGIVPPKSTLIGPARPLIPLGDLVMNLPPSLSQAVGDSMKTSAVARTQTAATFTSQFIESGFPNTAVFDTNKMPKSNRPQNRPNNNDQRQSKGFSAKYITLALGLTVVVLIGLMVIFMYVYYPSLMRRDDAAASSAAANNQSSQTVSEESLQQTAADDVPRFVGKTLEEVINNSDYSQKYDFSVKRDFNDAFPEGVIYDQSPLEGTKMPEKGTVILHVSNGLAIAVMPDLSGMKTEDALKILKAIDPDMQIQVFEKHDSNAPAETIISTSPNAEEEFDPKRRAVYIFVSPKAIESTPSTNNNNTTNNNTDENSSKPFFFYDSSSKPN